MQMLFSRIPETMFPLIFHVHYLQVENSQGLHLILSTTEIDHLLSYCSFIWKEHVPPLNKLDKSSPEENLGKIQQLWQVQPAVHGLRVCPTQRGRERAMVQSGVELCFAIAHRILCFLQMYVNNVRNLCGLARHTHTPLKIEFFKSLKGRKEGMTNEDVFSKNEISHA